MEVTRTLPASDENAPVGERLTEYVQHLRSVILPPARAVLRPTEAERAARPLPFPPALRSAGAWLGQAGRDDRGAARTRDATGGST